MKALEALHTFSHVPHRKYTPHTTTLHARSRCLRQQSNLIKILFQTDMTTACVAVGPQSGIVSRPFDYCDTVEKTFFFQNYSIINFKISWTSMYPQFHFPRKKKKYFSDKFTFTYHITTNKERLERYVHASFIHC